MLGQVNGFGSRIGADARDDRQAPGGVADCHADQFGVLVDIDSRGFARRAHDDQRVGAFLGVPVDQFAVAVVIHRAVGVHWRNQRNHAALKTGPLGG